MSGNNHSVKSDRHLIMVMFAEISGFTTMPKKMYPD